jgi:serine/threonine-protein kinase RsbW
MPRLTLDVGVDRLADVRAFVRDAAPSLGADEVAVADLVQAVDEWVTNVVTHGYREGHGPVEVELARDGTSVVVHVRDRAPAFDPRTAPPFDASLPLARRRPGGMGIHLIHTLMDSMERRPRAGGGNELTLRRSGRTAATGGNR